MLNHPLSENAVTISRRGVKYLIPAVFPFTRKMMNGRRWELLAAAVNATTAFCLLWLVDIMSLGTLTLRRHCLLSVS